MWKRAKRISKHAFRFSCFAHAAKRYTLRVGRTRPRRGMFSCGRGAGLAIVGESSVRPLPRAALCARFSKVGPELAPPRPPHPQVPPSSMLRRLSFRAGARAEPPGLVCRASRSEGLWSGRGEVARPAVP